MTKLRVRIVTLALIAGIVVEPGFDLTAASLIREPRDGHAGTSDVSSSAPSDLRPLNSLFASQALGSLAIATRFKGLFSGWEHRRARLLRLFSGFSRFRNYSIAAPPPERGELMAGLMGPGQIRVIHVSGKKRFSVFHRTEKVEFLHRPFPRGLDNPHKLKFMIPDGSASIARETIYRRVAAALFAGKEQLSATAPNLALFLDKAVLAYRDRFTGVVGLFEHHQIFKGIGDGRIIAVGKRFENNEAAWLHEILEMCLAPYDEETLRGLATKLLSPRGYEWFTVHRKKYYHLGATRHLLIRAMTKDALPASDDELSWLIHHDDAYKLKDDPSGQSLEELAMSLADALTFDEQKLAWAATQCLTSLSAGPLRALQSFLWPRAERRHFSSRTVNQFLEFLQSEPGAVQEFFGVVLPQEVDAETYSRYVTSERSVLHRLEEKAAELRRIDDKSIPNKDPELREINFLGRSELLRVDRFAQIQVGDATYSIWFDGQINEASIEVDGDDESDDLPLRQRFTVGRMMGDFQDFENPQLGSPHFSVHINPVRKDIFDMTIVDLSGKGVRVFYRPDRGKGAAREESGGPRLSMALLKKPIQRFLKNRGVVPRTAEGWAFGVGLIVEQIRLPIWELLRQFAGLALGSAVWAAVAISAVFAALHRLNVGKKEDYYEYWKGPRWVNVALQGILRTAIAMTFTGIFFGAQGWMDAVNSGGSLLINHYLAPTGAAFVSQLSYDLIVRWLQRPEPAQGTSRAG